MKNASREYLEASQPPDNAAKYIDFCLEQLYADTHHRLADEVVKDLTFEELLGALLAARRQIRFYEEEWDEEDDEGEEENPR